MADDYTVVAQRQTTDLGADGRFVDVVEVTFRTKGGTTGHVRVPLDRYTPDYVRERIEERVATTNAVDSL